MLQRLLFFLVGLLVGAASLAAAGPPLPFIQGKATITKITTAISGDLANPAVTVEAQAVNDGIITGGECTIVTANSAAARQFTVGSVVKLVLGGK